MGSDGFGPKLRALRRQQGMTQTELAGDGLSTSYVSLLETGKRTPTTEIALKLAARLNVAPEVLLEVGEAAAATGPAGERADLLAELLRAEREVVDGSPREARDIFTALLDRADGEIGAAAARGAALVAELLGELREAAALYARTLAAEARPWTTLGERIEMADGLVRCLCDLGAHETAAAEVEQAVLALEAARLETTPAAVALAATLAYVHLDQGDLDGADAVIARAATLAGHLADRESRYRSYEQAITLARDAGDAPRALALRRHAALAHRGSADSGHLARLRVAAAAVAAHRALATEPPASPPAHPGASGGSPTAPPTALPVAPAGAAGSVGAAVDLVAAELAELELYDTGLMAARWRLVHADLVLRAGRTGEVGAVLGPVTGGWPARSAAVAARAALLAAEAGWDPADPGASRGAWERAAAALVELGAGRLGAEAYFALARRSEHAGDAAGALAAYRTAAEFGLNTGFRLHQALQPEAVGDLKLR